jgi:hypothetical protein
MTQKPDYEKVSQIDNPDFISIMDFTITLKRFGTEPGGKYSISKGNQLLGWSHYEDLLSAAFKRPGQVSEDGVVLPKDNTFVYAVNKDKVKMQNPFLPAEPFSMTLPGVLAEYVLFATRENARKYIEFNQPQFSRHTLLSFFDSLNTSVEAADTMRAQFDKFQKGIAINNTEDKSLSDAF